MDYRNKNVLVLGLGASGLSASKRLKSMRSNVFIYDDNLQLSAKTAIENSYIFLRINEVEELISKKQIDRVILSPGISVNSKIPKLARKYNVDIVSELEFGAELFLGKSISITGTNGKTTTVSILDIIIKNAKMQRVLAGNIGTPISQVESSEDTVGIFEVSSFQLECAQTFHPNISAILNITSDHLDRHKTLRNYIAIKKRIYKCQDQNDYVVLNYDDEICRKIKNKKSKIVYFSCENAVNGAFLSGDNIIYGKTNEYITGIHTLKIKGKHNVINALCAITIAKLLKIPNSVIETSLSEFSGVPHRIEFVKTIDGINYYNDSKGTNIGSTLVACDSMDGDTVVILGGKDKGYEYDELFQKLSKKVSYALCFGETAGKIMQAAKRCGFDNITRCLTLKECVLMARYEAIKGGNVLLSPASSSFDMFRNYEDRGDKFVEIVNSL